MYAEHGGYGYETLGPTTDEELPTEKEKKPEILINGQIQRDPRKVGQRKGRRPLPLGQGRGGPSAGDTSSGAESDWGRQRSNRARGKGVEHRVGPTMRGPIQTARAGEFVRDNADRVSSRQTTSRPRQTRGIREVFPTISFGEEK